MVKYTREKALVSDLYEVYVKDGDDKWQKVTVYTTLCPDGSGYCDLPKEIFKEYNGVPYAPKAKKTYFACVKYQKPVSVKVIFNESVKSFSLRPDLLNKKYVQNDNCITFTAEGEKCIVIEADGDTFGSLNLFFNTSKENAEHKKKLIEFNEGYHTYKNNSHIVLNEHGVPVIDSIIDDTVIFIHDGAVVCASVVLDNVKNVTICGTGVISLVERCYGADKDFDCETLWGPIRYNALPNIYIHNDCSEITISGVVLSCEFRGIVIRNSSDINITNVKIFGNTINSDGINLVNVKRMHIKDSFIKCGDDCIAVFNSYDSIPTLNDGDICDSHSCDIEVDGCVLWTCCRVAMIGGHATNKTNPHDLIENVYIHDNEVLDVPNRVNASLTENSEESLTEHARYWSGILRLLSQSEQLVKNVVFKNMNIHFTKGYRGKCIHAEIRSKNNTSYSEGRGYKIENVLFENINFYNCPDKVMNSVFLADWGDEKIPDDYGIKNIRLKNVLYNGKRIENNDEYITVSGNVSDFIIE